MVDQEQAASYRATLEEERARIEAQLSDLGAGGSGALAYDPNFADSSQVSAERGEADLLARELRETLESVEDAIARIEGGSYGSCERCGQEIGSERLAAMPFVRYCISCASKS
jgi:RNA polymerase-binding transcription factor DksA